MTLLSDFNYVAEGRRLLRQDDLMMVCPNRQVTRFVQLLSHLLSQSLIRLLSHLLSQSLGQLVIHLVIQEGESDSVERLPFGVRQESINFKGGANTAALLPSSGAITTFPRCHR